MEQEVRIPETLRPFSEALQRSIQLYEQIRFDFHRDSLLKAFVDIVHDDQSLKRLFQISVTMPLLLGGLQARFYLYEKKTDQFLCVCDSENGLLEPPRPAGSDLPSVSREVQEYEGQLFYPLSPHTETIQQEGQAWHGGQEIYDPDPYFASHSLLGLYAVSPLAQISDEDKEFFHILSRWIGNKLNNRLIAKRHLEHLKFINDLGRDIGHNIIIPNMYLKYLLGQMKKQIVALKETEQSAEALDVNDASTREYVTFLDSCRETRQALEQTHRDLLKHHNQITLFQESLFRKQHFSEGHLVLQPTSCFVERDIILPQLDLYLKKLERQGITIDKPSNLHTQEFPLMVDIGLLSQVYANLFANAVNYTGEIINHQGQPRKALAYGAEVINDFPDSGHRGIKFNVFTTGPALPASERQKIFEEGTRAKSSQEIEGSGHGLNFIRRVIEVHGGRVGCEATEEGNNFYFILPLPKTEQQGNESHQA
ncbi:MAG: ATP-binding protein [Desulfocapsaceae bacterium]|nr:ATP-binding protein [Desulfocapsaceae bacterium]